MPIYVARISAVDISTATTKTLVQVKANAAAGLKVKDWGLSFSGIDATKIPVLADLLIQTTAGTMTSLTPVKTNRVLRASLSTAQHTATAEPTASDILWSQYLTPANGFDRPALPLSEEFELGVAEYIGLRVTTPEAVTSLTAAAWIRFED